MSKHINKQTSPIFNCVTLVSVSLAPLELHTLLHLPPPPKKNNKKTKTKTKKATKQ